MVSDMRSFFFGLSMDADGSAKRISIKPMQLSTTLI